MAKLYQLVYHNGLMVTCLVIKETTGCFLKFLMFQMLTFRHDSLIVRVLHCPQTGSTCCIGVGLAVEKLAP